jgi:hypothetical protein
MNSFKFIVENSFVPVKDSVDEALTNLTTSTIMNASGTPIEARTHVTQGLVRAFTDRCEMLLGARGPTVTDHGAMMARYHAALLNLNKNATEAVEDANCLRNLGADYDRFADVCPRAYRYANIGFEETADFTKAINVVTASGLKDTVMRMINNLSVKGIVGHAANPAMDCLAYSFLMGAFIEIMTAALVKNARRDLAIVETSHTSRASEALISPVLEPLGVDLFGWEQAYKMVTSYMETPLTCDVDVDVDAIIVSFV